MKKKTTKTSTQTKEQIEARDKVKKETVQKPVEKGKRTLSIAETKLGVTLVLSKEDCKKIGISEDTMTRDAIRQIRAKLGAD